MAENVKKYTSTAEVQDFWINEIAPKYFDFENTNNYRAGIFGYINEVMSTSIMDTHQSINIARREFYPVSAQNAQSIYKMAVVQHIDLPMATPARCSAILLLDRDEVISNSTYKNGIYTCMIDNSVQILADNMQFSLLYPIAIISNHTNGEWTHTIHYDKGFSNSLDDDNSLNYYITNKTINQDGKRYLMLAVNLRQTKIESISQLVTTDTMVDTVSLLFTFEGTIANFEAFYIKEPDVSDPVQLVKLMEGESIVEKPFCYYRMLSSNMIELTFPKNIYFTPEMNSEIRLDVYTSLGNSGNFESFNGSLTCSMESERYPYNNNMTMMGIINGSSTGGRDIPTLDEFAQTVKRAYATNNTLTTSNDLQLEFDSLSEASGNNKIIFRKKRMDAFSRDYGAYALLKMESGEVVPTNTLSITIGLDELDTYSDTTMKGFIKPGTLFKYDPDSLNDPIYSAVKVGNLSLKDELTTYEEKGEFLYTNPFLIGINLNPNLIGYYSNSLNETRPVEYTYINDSTVNQFIGSNLTIDRNAINGENFYRFTLKISPTTDLDKDEIVVVNTEEADDYYIRATQNGSVDSVVYNESGVVCNIIYEDGSTDTIQVSSYVEQTADGYEYVTGYKLNVEVYSSFVEGDILATKKVTDLGKIRACIDLENILYVNGLYIPMIIEDYNETLNQYTLAGYISTDDVMSDNGTFVIDRGIYETSGHENEHVSIKYDDIRASVSVFYENDDMNYTHKYSNFDYFRKHSLTNTYGDSSDDGIALIYHIDYIRSVLTFTEDTRDIDTGFKLNIKEIPFVRASWIKLNKNFNYLSNSIISTYKKLVDMYYNLENNYSIDLKFYNTYGKSKFFKVGIKNQWQPLSQVNLSFRFGVYLSSITTQSIFLAQFREYIKEKIESINSTTSGSIQSIYIMNLLSDISTKFPEIGYPEYYGFDEYDSAIQKIEPIPTSEMDDTLLTNYIPEFINISTYEENGETYPSIYVDFLNDES